ncbi:unnamed protein product [Heterobilharzia americana]|nr:unnamed protein product [Heterobilharzia americana]CAH8527554.1 unnamed protein product [Heterobilharzia americana]
MVSVIAKASKESHTTSATDQKMESKLNVCDLQAIYDAFSFEGKGYGNKLRLTKEQFAESMGLLISRGSRQEYKDLFSKIDITSDGFVDWDKFASYLLLEFYEQDNRQKILNVPQWKDLKSIKSPHKGNLQKIVFLKNISRYLSISREGLATLWGIDLKSHRIAKVSTESCRPKNFCVIDFAVMPNVNRVAVAFTSKEIAFCNLGIKMDLFCPIKLCDITDIPTSLNHWYKPDNPNEALLVWGDTRGYLNILFWAYATMALFEKPTNLSKQKEGKDKITVVLLFSQRETQWSQNNNDNICNDDGNRKCISLLHCWCKSSYKYAKYTSRNNLYSVELRMKAFSCLLVFYIILSSNCPGYGYRNKDPWWGRRRYRFDLAIASFVKSSNPGSVWFTPRGKYMYLNGSVSGLPRGKLLGVHIHQYGGLGNMCLEAGPHFNPFKQ